jgi:hypothetical protein
MLDEVSEMDDIETGWFEFRISQKSLEDIQAMCLGDACCTTIEFDTRYDITEMLNKIHEVAARTSNIEKRLAFFSRNSLEVSNDLVLLGRWDESAQVACFVGLVARLLRVHLILEKGCVGLWMNKDNTAASALEQRVLFFVHEIDAGLATDMTEGGSHRNIIA